MKNPAIRAVVTGIGVLAPNGNSLNSFWENTLRTRSGIGPITLFSTEDFPVAMAGEVKDFKLERFLDSSYQIKTKRLGRHTCLGIAAMHMALRHAKLHPADLKDQEPIDVHLGVSTSAIDVIEKGKEILTKKGPSRVSPYIVSACQPHAVACEIVETLGIRTRKSTHSSACPAGMEALAAAMMSIQNQEAPVVLCGGVDAPITPLTMASFHLAGLAPDTGFSPEQSSRPFDAKRKGGLIAEGAGMFVVESLEHALARGAEPLAELVGYGSTSDDPGTESGSGFAPAMREALDHAGLLPMDIGYVNAHGPSHPVLDRMESRAIHDVFGSMARHVPVSSIKGVIGNPLSAAGPLQLAASIQAIRETKLPPTANYEYPDPECDLQIISGSPLQTKVNRVLLNVHGLGGGNSTLIVKRMKVR